MRLASELPAAAAGGSDSFGEDMVAATNENWRGSLSIVLLRPGESGLNACFTGVGSKYGGDRRWKSK